MLDSGITLPAMAEESDPSISKANPFLDGYSTPVLPELKTIAKFSVAKIAIPDSSSDTLLSL